MMPDSPDPMDELALQALQLLLARETVVESRLVTLNLDREPAEDAVCLAVASADNRMSIILPANSNQSNWQIHKENISAALNRRISLLHWLNSFLDLKSSRKEHP